MNRVSAAFGSIVFFFLAPGTIAGAVPWLISRWTVQPTRPGGEPIRMAGVAIISAGLIVLIDSFRRFAMEGLGTPAPVLPTKHLVVSGWYRHVRNPMYIGAALALFGAALVYESMALVVYGGAFLVITHLFVLWYEEPALRRKFGQDYAAYCRQVRRWWPRP